MTAFATELLLLAAIVVLYLHDGARLLGCDELMLVRRQRRWQVVLDTGLEARGRQLFVPAPLAPWRMQLRCNWFAEAGAAADGINLGQLQRRRRLLRPLQPLCTLVLAGLVALPLALIWWPRPWLLLSLLVLVYASTLLMLGWVSKQRRALQLGRRALLGLWLDCLLCPPYAANLLRRLCVPLVLQRDALAGVLRRQPTASRQRLAGQFEQRLALLAMSDDSGRHAARFAACRQWLRQTLAPR